jgi:hypothetical protein
MGILIKRNTEENGDPGKEKGEIVLIENGE